MENFAVFYSVCTLLTASHTDYVSLYSTTALFSAVKLTVSQKIFIIICSLKVSVC